MTQLPPEQASLLTAITAASEDDTPRLAYADWLDEHGDPEQAAFIRASIRYSQMDSSAEGWYELHVQLTVQWQKHSQDWLARLGITYDPRDGDAERGLLSGVSYFAVDDFLASADNLFAYTPIKVLQVCGDSDDSRALDDAFFTRLGSLPGLSRIRDLCFRNNGRPVSPQGIEFLVRSPYIGPLRTLVMENFQLTDEHAEVLAHSPNLANLDELDLALNELSPAGAFALLRSPHLAGLKWLSFEECLNLSPNGPFEVPEGRELMAAMRARFGPLSEGRNYL
jgi:uncharacterized protein (TIGR02996 family)